MRLLFVLTLLPVILFGDPLRMIVDNHEEELRSFEERLTNQETIMESIRNLVQESGSEQKNQVATSLSAQERQVKQLHDKISELEKKAQAQAKQINLLQDALKTFIDSFQTDTAPASTDTIASKTYTVKNGDSLGKIAKAHKTSTQTLRGMNNLSGDKIIVGQKIKVPEL